MGAHSHLAQLAPHWLHWLAYQPGVLSAAVLCLLWPAGLGAAWIRGRIFRRPPPAYLGDWPDDYDMIALARLTDPADGDAPLEDRQAAGLGELRRIGSAA